MHTKLSCLSERHSTTIKLAYKRPLTSMHIEMFFKILTKRESLTTNETCKGFNRSMTPHVSSK